jgi:multidrug resistance efflux pump
LIDLVLFADVESRDDQNVDKNDAIFDLDQHAKVLIEEVDDKNMRENVSKQKETQRKLSLSNEYVFHF